MTNQRECGFKGTIQVDAEDGSIGRNDLRAYIRHLLNPECWQRLFLMIGHGGKAVKTVATPETLSMEADKLDIPLIVGSHTVMETCKRYPRSRAWMTEPFRCSEMSEMTLISG